MKRTAKGLAVSTGEARSTFLASTDALARDGMIIEKNAWQLENFKRNPIILWSHRYDSLPIGRATSVRTTDAGLVVDIEFDLADSFAADVARKVKAGFLSAVSVGFDVLTAASGRITKAELLEISVVPVPADPGALAIARSAYAKSRGSSSDDWWKQPLSKHAQADLRAVSKAIDRAHAQLIQSNWKREAAQEKAAQSKNIRAAMREAIIVDGLRRMSESQRVAFLKRCTIAELAQIDAMTRHMKKAA